MGMGIGFCSVASGSNGNCTFISSGGTKILIDAGLTGVQLEKRLNSFNESAANLDGIFVTHEHSDHISGVGVLSRKHDVPIFATPGTWQGIDKDRQVGRIAPHNRRYVYLEENLMLNDMRIKPFSIPHDAQEPVGYIVEAGGCKTSVATDLGCILPGIAENIKDSDIILIESNHDENLVAKGKYSEWLKKRILGNKGHLSNVNCAKLLTEVLTDRTKHVVLGHLSDENNLPELAFETVFKILKINQFKVNENFKLHVAVRGKSGYLLEI